jgi:hypothetical protein
MSTPRTTLIPPLARVLADYAVRGAELQIVTPSATKRPRRIALLRDFMIESLGARCRAHDGGAG